MTPRYARRGRARSPSGHFSIIEACCYACGVKLGETYTTPGPAGNPPTWGVPGMSFRLDGYRLVDGVAQPTPRLRYMVRTERGPDPKLRLRRALRQGIPKEQRAQFLEAHGWGSIAEVPLERAERFRVDKGLAQKLPLEVVCPRCQRLQTLAAEHLK